MEAGIVASVASINGTACSATDIEVSLHLSDRVHRDSLSTLKAELPEAGAHVLDELRLLGGPGHGSGTSTPKIRKSASGGFTARSSETSASPGTTLTSKPSGADSDEAVDVVLQWIQKQNLVWHGVLPTWMGVADSCRRLAGAQIIRVRRRPAGYPTARHEVDFSTPASAAMTAWRPLGSSARTAQVAAPRTLGERRFDRTVDGLRGLGATLVARRSPNHFQHHRGRRGSSRSDSQLPCRDVRSTAMRRWNTPWVRLTSAEGATPEATNEPAAISETMSPKMFSETTTS
jgi:hypothetical protein